MYNRELYGKKERTKENNVTNEHVITFKVNM